MNVSYRPHLRSSNEKRLYERLPPIIMVDAGYSGRLSYRWPVLLEYRYFRVFCCLFLTLSFLKWETIKQLIRINLEFLRFCKNVDVDLCFRSLSYCGHPATKSLSKDRQTTYPGKDQGIMLYSPFCVRFCFWKWSPVKEIYLFQTLQPIYSAPHVLQMLIWATGSKFPTLVLIATI